MDRSGPKTPTLHRDPHFPTVHVSRSRRMVASDDTPRSSRIRPPTPFGLFAPATPAPAGALRRPPPPGSVPRPASPPAPGATPTAATAPMVSRLARTLASEATAWAFPQLLLGGVKADWGSESGNLGFLGSKFGSQVPPDSILGEPK